MSRNQPRLVVLNHALHAKGYRLDTIDGHIHIAKGDGYKALLVLWPNVVYYMPCWDILTRHAFSVGQGSSELQDDEATQGLLEGIFSPRMDGVFRNALDVDFIGACMFDWTNLAFVLDRLANASAWSEPNSPHWQYIPEISITDNRMEHARILIRNVRSFLTNIRQAVGCSAWGGLLYYSGLCNAILLDCVKHSDFKRVVAALKAAATELNYITFDYWTHAEVAESEAARIRSYHALTAKFQGRCLFWTKKGFHGLSSPGVEGCGNAVVLLDGLSFPMVIRDVEGDDSGRARLVGCALIRGVDMRKSRDTGSAKLPAGFSLEEKTVFKFV